MTWALDNIVNKLNDIAGQSSGTSGSPHSSDFHALKDQIQGIDGTLKNMEKAMKYDNHRIDNLHSTIRDHHDKVPEHIQQGN